MSELTSPHLLYRRFSTIKNVIFALLIREAKTRFGESNLGYLYVLIEPLAFIVVISVFLSTIGRYILPGADYVIFVLTSLVPWQFFTNMVNRSLFVIDANRGLLSYRNVKPIDDVIARLLLEGVIYLLVYVLFITGLGMFGYDIHISHPLELIGILLLFVSWTFGLSVLMCVVGVEYPESQKMVLPLMAGLRVISAVYFPLALIPEKYHLYIIWNPALHFIELIHQYYLSAYIEWHGSILYVLICTLVTLLLAFAVYYRRRETLLGTHQ